MNSSPLKLFTGVITKLNLTVSLSHQCIFFYLNKRAEIGNTG